MNSTQRSLSLRELAKEYAGGGIDRQTYRQRRTRLLNELAASAPAVETVPQQTPQHQNSVIHGTKDRKTGKLIVGGVVTLGLLFAAGLLYRLVDQPEQTQQEQPASAVVIPQTVDEPSPSAPAPRTAHEEIEDPVQAFLDANDWATESREQLLAAWDGLSSDQRQRLSGNSAFLAFSAELRNRIKEERGLAGTGGSAELDALTGFATRLGLDVALVENPIDQMTDEPAIDSRPVSSSPESPPPSVQKPPVPDEPVTPESAPEDAEAPTTAPLSPAPSSALGQERDVAIAPVPIAEEQPQATRATPASEPSASEPPVAERIDQTESSCRPLPGRRKTIRCHDRLSDGKKGPSLRLLPGGRFIMGRDEVESEAPAHGVTIAYPFAIGTYEVSQREYIRYCETTGQTCPAQPWPDTELPVVNVSREDAIGYAQWLNSASRKGYRLPTEAEWEYAARAGSRTAYPLPESDLGTYAHYSDREQEQAPLPRKPRRTNPNAFGVYHMAGNVREWVLDSWRDGYKGAPVDGSPYRDEQQPDGIVRGGSYADGKAPLRSSARQRLAASTRDTRTGFRLVRDVYVGSAPEELTRWGDWWLSFQRPAQSTIQLFATNQLERVRQLIEQHPGQPIKVVSSNRPNVKYLILLGIYETARQAELAYRDLPATLKPEGSKRVIKSIADLR